MPRWEISVRVPIEQDGIDWEAMNLPVPKSEYTYRRRYIDTCDCEWLQEKDDTNTYCKLSYEEMPLVIEGAYDDLCIALDDIEQGQEIEWEFEPEGEQVDEGQESVED